MATLPLHRKTLDFLARPQRMLIGDQWLDASSGSRMQVRNPATGEPLASVPSASAEDVDRAVQAARSAFYDSAWNRIRPRERQNLLWRLAELIERDADVLAELECLNNGKSAQVARAMDVQLCIDFLRYMAGWATKIEGSTVEPSLPLMPNEDFHAYIRREAVGVVGAIVAWNFPLLLACWKLGPALASGCTLVLKPADETPLSALKLAELVQEAGYPAGVFNVVTGTGLNAGAALSSHPGVDKLTFTGSTEVGKQIGEVAEEPGDLERRRKEYELDLEGYSVEKGSIGRRMQDLDRTLVALKHEMEHAAKQEVKHQRLSLRVQLAQDAADAIGAVYGEFANRLRARVEEHTRALFQQLVWKGTQFTGVNLGPDYDLQVTDRWGLPARPDLSAGERQVLSLAFIGAMGRVSEEEAPLVMDTPFGRLSSVHRNSVTAHLPSLTHQLVLLVTDEELRDQARHNIEPHIGFEYRLEFDETEGSTCIVEIPR